MNPWLSFLAMHQLLRSQQNAWILRFAQDDSVRLDDNAVWEASAIGDHGVNLVGLCAVGACWLGFIPSRQNRETWFTFNEVV